MEYLERAKDKETFLDFAWALVKDREDSVEKEKISPGNPYGPDANGWENISIEGFFEAALRCAQDAPERMPEDASWQAFAGFLYGGKIYE